MVNQSLGTFFRHPINTADVVKFLGDLTDKAGEIIGVEGLTLYGVCDSRSGGQGQLVFSSAQHYSANLGVTESLVLIDEFPDESERGSNQFLRVGDPRAVFIDTLEWLTSKVGVDAHKPGFRLHTAISKEAKISPYAFIETGVEIGAGSIVCAGAVIKVGTWIGENTVVRENAVIGSDGVTAYRATDGRLLKFPHVGGVRVGSNSEIGANTVITGGILAPTSIADNVVIGNLCNVGHGAAIDDGVWMSVGSLIGGHTRVRSGATIAMGVTVRDNLTIGKQASLGMGSVIVKNIEPGHSMFGNPAKRMPNLKTGPSRS